MRRLLLVVCLFAASCQCEPSAVQEAGRGARLEKVAEKAYEKALRGPDIRQDAPKPEVEWVAFAGDGGELAPFELMRTEVTRAQYRLAIEAGASEPFSRSYLCRETVNDSEAHPVRCVDRKDASKFCAWLGGRLPTGAEWEHAARSATARQRFPWGAEPASCQRAVLWDDAGFGCGKDRPWPVCSIPAGHSAQGLCDLVGNVAEWVADCPKAVRGLCLKGVLRGASWRTPVAGYEVGDEIVEHSGSDDADFGFRCAR